MDSRQSFIRPPEVCAAHDVREELRNITNNYNDFEIDEELARFQD